MAHTETKAPTDFNAAYQECAAPLRAFLVVRAGRTHCDDVLQEVWTRALAAWSSFDGENVKAWLFRIAHNCLIDLHRKKRPEAMAELHQRADERIQAADAIALESERRLRLQGCLKKLADEFRQVAQSLLGGDSADEIAQRMGIPRATVYTRWHRAKDMLHHCVNGSSS